MYAVIFKAEIKKLDESYTETARRMRELASSKYGCTHVISNTEGKSEITISYWDSLAQISNWKKDAEHIIAQTLGKNTWYRSYEVEIVEIIKNYKSPH